LMDSGGCPKIADFGLSQIIAEFAEPETMESFSESSRYMAPELVSDGGSQPTFASDVYGFACVAYEVRIIFLYARRK
jgi:serine/threonine protein kinase